MLRDKALLVGFCPKNFSQEILQNPRLCFWHKTLPANDRKSQIPGDVSVVILVPRFCGKERINKIRGMLGSGIELLTRFTGTGQVKKYLEDQGYVPQVNNDTEHQSAVSKGSRTIGEMYSRLVPESMQLPPVNATQLPDETEQAEPEVPVEPQDDTTSQTSPQPAPQEIAVNTVPETIETSVPEVSTPVIKSPRTIFSEALDFVNLAVAELVAPQNAILNRNTELEELVIKLSADLEQEKVNTANLLKDKEAELETLRENNRQLNSQVREIPRLRDAKTMTEANKQELATLRYTMEEMKKRYKFIGLGKEFIAALKSEDAEGIKEEIFLRLEELGLTTTVDTAK